MLMSGTPSLIAAVAAAVTRINSKVSVLFTHYPDAGGRVTRQNGMSSLLLTRLAILDVDSGKLVPDREVRIQGETIVAIGARLDRLPDDEVIDLGGRVLMPGLIDCHVHLNRASFQPSAFMLPSLLAAHAGVTLHAMLDRGFTTVRDAGGADAGHRQAIELGLFKGPRLFVSGRAISQTGGHGDIRFPADLAPLCQCASLMPGCGRVADGVPEVRRAVRDEIRLGADQIKLMAGGGVGTLTDPIDHLQYSTEEIEAVVDEATRAHKYVMAHVYTPEGIRRCVEAGVRTIEHGHFLDVATADLMAQRGAILSINLLIYSILANEGLRLGYHPTNVEKAKGVLDVGFSALDIARRAGVPIAFGTDLSRVPERQGEEFLVRAELMPNAEVIRSATRVGAQVVRMPDRIGVVKEGALADLIVVDGNPLENIRLLADDGASIPLILKEGRIVKNLIQSTPFEPA
ncbi:MAG: amidohydrolase family protein [Burkholderiaceae bacterium]|nr:amidohydrolase family protein [Burkholderiaceae bacterium]